MKSKQKIKQRNKNKRYREARKKKLEKLQDLNELDDFLSAKFDVLKLELIIYMVIKGYLGVLGVLKQCAP